MAARRFRTKDSYRRRGPTREPYDAVIIVCEGGKTEPLYFDGLKRAYRLSSANVDVQPMGMDPLRLVDHAIAELGKDATLTRAYAVFDRDQHPTFGDAIRKARDHKEGKSGRLRVVVSVPCFEVWLLLHFRYSTAEIAGGGGKTPGERAVADLQALMPGYTKAEREIFATLASKLEDAMRNAARLAEHNRQSLSENPATDIHQLVAYLTRLNG